MVRRRNNNIYIFLIIVVLFFMGIGYSYLNSSLYINGTSIINANLWDVGLDNLNITTGSVAAISEPIVNSSVSSTNYSVKLVNQDDFYEFTVDVVNNGNVDAKLGSLVETVGLTTEQEQYFDYNLTYQNNVPIQVNQIVKKDEYVRLKSRVEYKEEVNITSVPESVKTLNLGFKLNYDLDDGNGISVRDNGVFKLISIINGDGTQTGDELCIREECFYVMYSDEDTVTMLSKYNLYVGGEYKSSWKEYGDEATGIQDLNMLGYVVNQNIRKGTTKFSNTNYWSGTVKVFPTYVYDLNSVLYSYVENYKMYLSNLEVIPNEARLITYEELINLGCTGSSCSSAASWVYATSYWTGSVSSSSNVWRVYSNGSFSSNDFTFNYSNGCRPVIVIPKSLISVD